MLTARGWWVLTLAAILTAAGLLAADRLPAAVPLLGLTLLGWFVASWIAFAVRYRDAISTLTVTRSLTQGGRPVSSVWARVRCTIRVELNTTGRFAAPLAFAADRPSVGVELTDEPAAAGRLGPEDPLVIEYAVTPPGPGVLRFEGVAVRVADLCGFFYRRAFARDPMEVLVLPQLLADDTHRRTDKRFNMLPTPGVHRLRRAGGGSELLDLRDYRLGDPPKTIAWKASARRDRLITKEFESDVPIRCRLFVDTSQSVRGGPPGQTPLARMVDVAAAVAQAAATNRDFVGLTTFDETATATTAPARTRVHTIRLMAKLAAAAGLPPAARVGNADEMMRAAEPIARELYPDLFAADLNTTTLGMYWRPLLDTKWGWLVPLMMLSPLLLLKREVAEAVARAAAYTGGRGNVLITFALFAALPVTLGYLFWIGRGLSGFFDMAATKRRKQLAAAFAALDGDTPAAVERYQKDDGAMAARAAAFLAAHAVRPAADAADPPPDARKIEVLADALRYAVATARDNELFVVFADLVDHAADIEPLARVVRAARARHHSILILVPWPAGVPAVDAGERRPTATPRNKPPRIAQLMRAGLIRQYQRMFADLRTTLVRAGASVVRVDDADALKTVLDRLDRVRGVRARR